MQAIHAIQAHKTADEKMISDKQGRRGELLLSGSEKELKSVERDIEALRASVSDAEAMLPILQKQLAEAERAEKVAEYRKRLAALDFEGKRQKFAEAWPRYEPLAKEIAQILVLEAEAFNAMARTRQLRQELENLGETENLPDLQSPARAAGAWIRGSTIGALVRLPSQFGHPDMVFEPLNEVITRMVPNYQYNEWTRTTVQKGEREHTETVTRQVAKIEGAPIWWPSK